MWVGRGGRQGNLAEQCERDIYGAVLLAVGRVGDCARAKHAGSNRRGMEHRLPVECTFHSRIEPEWRRMLIVRTGVDDGAQPA